MSEMDNVAVKTHRQQEVVHVRDETSGGEILSTTGSVARQR